MARKHFYFWLKSKDHLSNLLTFQPMQSENYQLEPLAIAPKYSLGCDTNSMIVKASDQSSKKLCCPFCDKMVSKLSRHLEAIHKLEPDVQKFMSLEKGKLVC